MTKIIKNSDCLIVIEPVLSVNFAMLAFILTSFDQLFSMNYKLIINIDHYEKIYFISFFDLCYGFLRQ